MISDSKLSVGVSFTNLDQEIGQKFAHLAILPFMRLLDDPYVVV